MASVQIAAPAAVAGRRRIARPWHPRSLALRLLVLILVFLTVPVVIYGEFSAADREQQSLLLASARREGGLIAEALRARLEDSTTVIPQGLGEALNELVAGDVRIRLLVRPSGVPDAAGHFFYVAAAPPLQPAMVDEDFAELSERGILDRLDLSCEGDEPLAVRLTNPEGAEEVLTSITPITTPFGCWAVIASQSSATYLGSSIGQPYWQTPEVRAAAFIYIGMAVLALAIFFDVWRNLRRFGRLAQQIVSDRLAASSFAEQNTVPELHGVARDFDGLVASLRHSAEGIRRAAEDNAHAFKTPIGVIRQSLEPIRKLTQDDTRAGRSVALIEAAVNRLDSLVAYVQHMDEATAELFQPVLQQIDLTDQLDRMLRGLRDQPNGRDIRFRIALEKGLRVRASVDLLETVVENIIDNAFSFAPVGSEIAIRLVRTGSQAVLTIEDEGPGVAPAKLEKIFERYFSERDQQPTTEAAEPHFGIGLWLVRRNVEAMGGTITAQNRRPHGLAMRITLPLETRG